MVAIVLRIMDACVYDSQTESHIKMGEADICRHYKAIEYNFITYDYIAVPKDTAENHEKPIL